MGNRDAMGIFVYQQEMISVLAENLHRETDISDYGLEGSRQFRSVAVQLESHCKSLEEIQLLMGRKAA